MSLTKQKLDMCSSTETEIVGVDDFMPAICWTCCFLKGQGCKAKDNMSEQDNKASVSLENNSKASSSKRTKHVNTCCFFVTDRIAKGELRVEWCPTAEMIRDHMTKSLQGRLFSKFCDPIMEAQPAQDPNHLSKNTANPSQEQTVWHCPRTWSGATGVCWSKRPNPPHLLIVTQLFLPKRA